MVRNWRGSNSKVYAITFVCCDFLSLLLQAIGGALTSTANIDTRLNAGTNSMVAGLSWQVASLLLFILLSAGFALSVHSRSKNPAFTELHQQGYFKLCLGALGIATVCIFIRCVFRVAELSKGFWDPLDLFCICRQFLHLLKLRHRKLIAQMPFEQLMRDKPLRRIALRIDKGNVVVDVAYALQLISMTMVMRAPVYANQEDCHVSPRET